MSGHIDKAMIPAKSLLGFAQAEGLYMEASLAVLSLGVILWDEPGSIRRTGSGTSNAQTSNISVTAGWK